MDAPTTGSPDAFALLSSVRIAKRLFTSNWYKEAAETLFDEPTRKLLREISEETEQERRGVLDVMRKWAAHGDLHHQGDSLGAEVARFSRVDILRSLMEAKSSAAQALEKVAMLAPRDLRDQILSLAAVDFHHSTRLREAILQEFPGRLPDWASGHGEPRGTHDCPPRG